MTIHVSEVKGLRTWRYVWIVGAVTPLEPTGEAAVWDSWREAIGHLSRVMFGLTPIAELAFAHFAVFCVEIRSREGVRLNLA